jgi:hypothetical protein
VRGAGRSTMTDPREYARLTGERLIRLSLATTGWRGEALHGGG